MSAERDGVVWRALGWLLRGVRAGDSKLLSCQFDAPTSLTVTSPGFEPGATIPREYWAAGIGDNRSPPLAVSGLPAGGRTVALVVEDPDAPMGMPFVHALAYWPAADSAELASDVLSATAGSRGLVKGKNSAGEVAYYGPAPLVCHGPHYYAFQAFALSSDPGLAKGFDRAALEAAMRDRVLAMGSLVGLCERR
jgi:Raf kinase inhibitor-like YbhB/YbcL family protein